MKTDGPQEGLDVWGSFQQSYAYIEGRAETTLAIARRNLAAASRTGSQFQAQPGPAPAHVIAASLRRCCTPIGMAFDIAGFWMGCLEPVGGILKDRLPSRTLKLEFVTVTHHFIKLVEFETILFSDCDRPRSCRCEWY